VKSLPARERHDIGDMGRKCRVLNVVVTKQFGAQRGHHRDAHERQVLVECRLPGSAGLNKSREYVIELSTLPQRCKA
jgi:hypothetical protein